MNNTDLFDFIFVDRYKEQKILENYLITSTDSTLWIYGKQGFGKTELTGYDAMYYFFRTFAPFYVKNCGQIERI